MQEKLFKTVFSYSHGTIISKLPDYLQNTCYEWHMFSQTDKSWKQFQKRFIKHNKNRKKQGTTTNAEYHNINIPRGTDNKENGHESDLASLTEAITLQTAAKSTKFTRMMDLFT